MKERQTISVKKRFANQSVEEYAAYLESILTNMSIDIIEMVWSPDKERFLCIIKLDSENEIASAFIENEIRFIDKTDYMQLTSNKSVRFLI
jgi:hypothetical protein